MILKEIQVQEHNESQYALHKKKFSFLSETLSDNGINVNKILDDLIRFQIAIPSWALGTGGTRFARFSGGGEPRTLEEKIEDVGMIHSLNKSSGKISLHIPWDIPKDYKKIQILSASFGIQFDAVNSNTFQDQPDQEFSYKFGSLQHTDKKVRQQAINHNKEVIKHGIELGSKSITVWLSDGSCFPGQLNFKKAFNRTLESLKEIYSSLPSDWRMFVEYKPYEPNFYSTTVGDWGTSLLFANKLGNQAFTLVDLGHHLPNTNIEQIVALLLNENKLGGFHFNDSKYGDDDLTVGSINPYQLFLIFNELVDSETPFIEKEFGWMIDASHNVKDPLEDLLQSVEAIKIAYAQALVIDRIALEEARDANDVVLCQEILQNAFRTDVRPLLAEARMQAGGALNPVQTYRYLAVRKNLISERGNKSVSSGL